MAKAAQSPDLRKAFNKHLDETQEHVRRLEKVFSAIDAKPQGKTCDAVLGLLEGESVMEDYRRFPGARRWSAGRCPQWSTEITRYGTLKTWASELDLKGVVELLDATLEEERMTDAALTELAVSAINTDAEAA